MAAADAAGNWSAGAADFHFTVEVPRPAAPLLTSPPDGALFFEPQVAFTWQPAAGAAGYQLDIGSTLLTTTLTAYTTTLPAGPYTWTVRAFNSVLNLGQAAPDRSFSIEIPAFDRYVAGPAGLDSGDCHSPLSPCSTLTYAINQAVAGDTVAIAAGTYTGHFTISKPLTLTGELGVAGGQWLLTGAETILDGGGSGGAVLFFDNGSDGSVLERLTITHGNGDDAGGVHAGRASLTIRECLVQDNVADGSPYSIAGGGVLGGFGDKTLTILNSRILNNQVLQGAGGVRVHQGILTIVNSLLAGNTGDFAIHVNGPTSLMNVTLTDNANGVLLNASDGTPHTLVNSILWGNGNNLAVPGGTLTASYSDVQGGWAGTGMLNADPFFVDATGSDYRLSPGSPCTNSGTASGAPAFDIDGNWRLGLPDMGAFEWFVRLFLPVALTKMVAAPARRDMQEFMMPAPEVISIGNLLVEIMRTGLDQPLD